MDTGDTVDFGIFGRRQRQTVHLQAAAYVLALDLSRDWSERTPPCDENTAPAPEAEDLPIVAGEAARTVAAAVSNLVAAVLALEKVAMACARAIDERARAKSGKP